MRIMKNNAQVVLEFTFAMVILFLMLYGLLKIFHWTGLDLADRRKMHDALLVNADVVQSYNTPGEGALLQIDPNFHRPLRMNAVWDEQ